MSSQSEYFEGTPAFGKEIAMPSTTGGLKPETMLMQLRRLIPNLIQEMVGFLESEFGSSSDYGIQGIVVVGSVAAQTERPDSDVDYYILSTSKGYAEDFDDRLARRVGRITDNIGTIRVDLEEKFDPEDWSKNKELEGHRGEYNIAYQVILREDAVVRDLNNLIADSPSN